MTRQELAQACDRIGAYFGKAIAPAQIDEWFRVIRNSDGGPALVAAVDRVLVECDTIPRNVPKTIAGYIADWKAEHPERTATGQREACEECWMGSGVIYAYRSGDTELKHRHAISCGHCRPMARGAMTVRQVEAVGFWIDVPKSGGEVYHNLRDDTLAARLLRLVPALAKSKAFMAGGAE